MKLVLGSTTGKTEGQSWSDLLVWPSSVQWSATVVPVLLQLLSWSAPPAPAPAPGANWWNQPALISLVRLTHISQPTFPLSRPCNAWCVWTWFKEIGVDVLFWHILQVWQLSGRRRWTKSEFRSEGRKLFEKKENRERRYDQRWR